MVIPCRKAAAGLRLFDHILGHAVFDTAARIQVLGLRVDAVSRQVLQADNRRVADRIQDAVRDFHAVKASLAPVFPDYYTSNPAGGLLQRADVRTLASSNSTATTYKSLMIFSPNK